MPSADVVVIHLGFVIIHHGLIICIRFLLTGCAVRTTTARASLRMSLSKFVCFTHAYLYYIRSLTFSELPQLPEAFTHHLLEANDTHIYSGNPINPVNNVRSSINRWANLCM